MHNVTDHHGVLPPSSKATLVQLGELMSQRYSPPVFSPLWPLQPLAFGAPTSSLKQIETWQSVAACLNSLSVPSELCVYSFCFLAPWHLFLSTSCYYDTFWSRVSHSSHSHAQLCRVVKVEAPIQVSKTRFNCLLRSIEPSFPSSSPSYSGPHCGPETGPHATPKVLPTAIAFSGIYQKKKKKSSQSLEGTLCKQHSPALSARLSDDLPG